MPIEAPSLSLAAALRLCLASGVGPRIRMRLIERFGSPEGVFAAPRSAWREVEGVGPKVCQSLGQAALLDVDAQFELCAQRGIEILMEGVEPYPPYLQAIPDPPGVLFIKGDLLPRDELAIAIVGTRHPTRYGIDQAKRLAGSLVRAGYAIVSGLARGIDAAAHRGALEAGGRTLAVLAGGLGTIYPPEHDKLAEEIAASGALVSEHPPLFPLQEKGLFPRRNRIISGLSLGLLVVEAGARSGALISAQHAMEQGREVFAVPGPVDSRASHGCHKLLREGAKLVETADDILEELGPLAAPIVEASDAGATAIHHPAELLLNDRERAVLDAIGTQATSIDDVVADSKIPIAQVLATISVLEMKRLIRRISGQLVCRK